MIRYEVYKFLHLTGVLMVFLALGGVATNAILGVGKNNAWRKPLAITHGVGLLLSLVAGFGLLARLGIVQSGFPIWVWLKLLIWLIFGGIIAVFFRKPHLAKAGWWLMIVLGLAAAYLAGSKPF